MQKQTSVHEQLTYLLDGKSELLLLILGFDCFNHGFKQLGELINNVDLELGFDCNF